MPDAPPEPPPPAPRRWVPLLLGASALVLAPAVLALVLLGSRFRPLSHPIALDHAQIARHVAEGRGLSTSSIRPLSVALQTGVARHPDLAAAPGHPLLLAAAFSLRRPSDRVVAAVGLGLWCLTVPLTFLLARRAFGTGPAALAAILYAANTVLLKAALQGLPHPLLALVVLGAAFLLLVPAESRAPVAALGGALAALGALSHFALFFFAPVLLVALAASRRHRGRAALVFAGVFLLVLLPWAVRNVRLTGQPLFSLYWYEALAGTAAFPGDSVWRSFDAAALGPLDFLFTHPLQSARRILTGLLRFWQETPQVLDPVVLLLAAAGLCSGTLHGRPTGWIAVLAGGAAAAAGASCVFRAEPELLLAWAPIACIAAGAWLADALRRIRDGVSVRIAWQIPIVRRLFTHPERLRVVAAALAAAAVLFAVFLPLAHHLWVFRPDRSSVPAEAEAVRKTVPADATVLTDQPGFLAWHAQRRAVWLCLRERDWDALESRGVRVDAAYTTPAAASLLPPGGAGWLWWVASPRGIYRDLVPAGTTPLSGLIRVRK